MRQEISLDGIPRECLGFIAPVRKAASTDAGPFASNYSMAGAVRSTRISAPCRGGASRQTRSRCGSVLPTIKCSRVGDHTAPSAICRNSPEFWRAFTMSAEYPCPGQGTDVPADADRFFQQGILRRSSVGDPPRLNMVAMPLRMSGQLTAIIGCSFYRSVVPEHEVFQKIVRPLSDLIAGIERYFHGRWRG